MKIGVLTYHCVPNFGAQLQTISTVGFLKKMGHEPIVLNWYPKELEDMYSKRIPSAQVKAHNKFMNENIPISDLCRTDVDLAKVIDDLHLEAIFEGSDALFKYIPKKKRVYFAKKKLHLVHVNITPVDVLDGNCFFASFYKYLKNKIPLVGFSISSQNCPYQLMDNQEKNEMSKALSVFKELTVRDEWTKEMVKSLNPKRGDIKITPDPVFSFNSNCYIAIPSRQEILKKFNLPENYIRRNRQTLWGGCADANPKLSTNDT